MNYLPKNIVIGYYTSYMYSFKEEKSYKARFGFPSCKWLQDGKYTDVNRFSSLTNGIKPHTQRNVEIQINKDLRVTIDIFENEFVDNFRLRYFSSGIVIIEDPRGFCVTLPLQWLSKALMRSNCSVSSDGIISGKWAYLFKNESFSDLVNENDTESIDIDDEMIDERRRNSISISSKDLEVSTVYDIKNEDNPLIDTRYVYAGKFKMLDISKFHTVVNGRHYSYSSKIGMFEIAKKDLQLSVHSKRLWYIDNITEPLKDSFRTFVKNLDIDSSSATLPWNNNKYVKAVTSLLNSEKEVPVFIMLKDMIQQNRFAKSDYMHYLEDLLDPSLSQISVHENSILLSTDLHCTSIALGSNSFLKRITKKSDDQSICVKSSFISRNRMTWEGLPQAYSSAKEFKTYSIDDIIAGVEAFKKTNDETVKKWLELLPISKPNDAEAYKNVLLQRLFNVSLMPSV